MEVSRIEFFEPVLSLIKDNNVKNFCILLLNDADDYFFIEPASSSGKYHPKFAIGKSGLAKHSIAVAIMLNEILSTDCYNFNEKEKDLLIAAAIVHDIKKYGKGCKYTVKNHALLAADFIEEHSDCGLLKREEIDFLTGAVASHMGKHGSTIPISDAEKLLHIADCIASRRYIDIDFKSVDIPGSEIISETVIKSINKPGDYLMPFGKHKGEKISQIYENDTQYLIWLCTKYDGKPGPAIENGIEYLKEKGKLNG